MATTLQSEREPVPPPLNARARCPRCRRPASACWCADLTPITTATRVVFLQHPREARVAIGTARIAHLGLAGSELYEGIEFAHHPRVAELVASRGAVLLFPGRGAVAPDALDFPPKTLVVIDGTWPEARKMIALNPALNALPRVGFAPRKPGNYRIRREPAPHCVATVEAVVEVLTAFERAPDRFAQLLAAFDSMVERQLAGLANRSGPARRRLKARAPWWVSTAMPDLEALWPRLVAVAAEANAHRRNSGIPGIPELVQLSAVRLATGEAFHAFLAPRRPLAPNAARHLEVPADSLLAGLTVREALAGWNRFFGPTDRLVGWGSYSWELLAHEGWSPVCPPIDLRLVAAHRLKRRPGSPESAAIAMGGALGEPQPAPGRAGRALQAIAAFTASLLKEKRGTLGTDGRCADAAGVAISGIS